MHSFFGCSRSYNHSCFPTDAHHLSKQSNWYFCITTTSQSIKCAFVNTNVERVVSIRHSCCIHYLVLLHPETTTVDRIHFFYDVWTNVDICDSRIAVERHFFTQFTVPTAYHEKTVILMIFLREVIIEYRLYLLPLSIPVEEAILSSINKS